MSALPNTEHEEELKVVWEKYKASGQVFLKLAKYDCKSVVFSRYLLISLLVVTLEWMLIGKMDLYVILTVKPNHTSYEEISPFRETPRPPRSLP